MPNPNPNSHPNPNSSPNPNSNLHAAGLGALLGDPLVRALLVASGLRFMGGFTLGVWIVPFYRGAFPGEIGTDPSPYTPPAPTLTPNPNPNPNPKP